MMALALFVVAMLGIISMQKITVMSKRARQERREFAERIAQSWSAQLEMDATTWRTTFGGFLNNAAAWQRPVYIATRSFGSAFDALGNPLSDSSTDLAKARFCTHVRMSWLYPPNLGVGGNGMLRAEIRVFWLRDGEAALDSNATMCSAAQTGGQAQSIGLSNSYQFVYQDCRRPAALPNLMRARRLFQPRHAKARKPNHVAALGFTLVELMVAMTGGLFLAIVVFALSRDASRFYQREGRVANATLSDLSGFERLSNDVARAGHLTTPNIQQDPRVCNVPQAAWPAMLRGPARPRGRDRHHSAQRY